MTASAATRAALHVNQITEMVIGAAMKVHSALGPGLLESAYEACLVHELRKRGLKVESQVELPVVYDGVTIDLGYRLDLVVEDCVIVELECVEAFTPVHEAQTALLPEIVGQECRVAD